MTNSFEWDLPWVAIPVTFLVDPRSTTSACFKRKLLALLDVSSLDLDQAPKCYLREVGPLGRPRGAAPQPRVLRRPPAQHLRRGRQVCLGYERLPTEVVGRVEEVALLVRVGVAVDVLEQVLRRRGGRSHRRQENSQHHPGDERHLRAESPQSHTHVLLT